MHTVIIFVKNPEYGKVKTRLAKSIGHDKAMEIYLRLIEHTEQVVSKVKGINVAVFYSSFVEYDDLWRGKNVQKYLQSGEDLGDRMKAAFTTIFEQSEKVLIIGSDCAQLRPSHIKAGFDKLKKSNVVIGPSLDGGYYLLGMDASYPFLFDDIEWSTESVFASTVKKAKLIGISVAELEALSDIDYIEDWQRYGLDSQ